jgi:RNA polymerase sigma factor (TIGR02999 family)
MDPRVTTLLQSLSEGNRQALEDLMPLVYDEMRRIARGRLRYERSNHTLNTTALVHEAYLKLAQISRLQWQSRSHFLAIAAQAMRQVLVNYALSRKRQKRGGGIVPVPLEEAEILPDEGAEQILAVDAALQKLEALNPRHSRIVEYRYFGGLTIEETAAALEASPATVKREWTLLRAWLRRELEEGP